MPIEQKEHGLVSIALPTPALLVVTEEEDNLRSSPVLVRHRPREL